MNLSNIDTITAGKVKTSGVSSFMELELSQVYPNPAQPRKSFVDIEELAQSISTHGLIQPISVVKDGAGKYMIVSVERRYRASQSLNLKTIKAHIISADSKKMEEISLIENIQRNDLTDYEIANFISLLWESGQYTQKQELADAIGKSKSYVSKALGLLKLDDSIKEDLEANKSDIGLSVLEEVSRVKDKETQKKVFEKVKSGELKRDEIKNFTGETDKSKKDTKSYKIAYGFGTVNQIGTYISLVDGDFTGVLKIENGGEFLKTTHNREYKVSIEEM